MAADAAAERLRNERRDAEEMAESSVVAAVVAAITHLVEASYSNLSSEGINLAAWLL
jgi:hypothetical protein